MIFLITSNRVAPSDRAASFSSTGRGNDLSAQGCGVGDDHNRKDSGAREDTHAIRCDAELHFNKAHYGNEKEETPESVDDGRNTGKEFYDALDKAGKETRSRILAKEYGYGQREESGYE